MKFMHATIHFTAETDGAPRCGVGVQEAATFKKKATIAYVSITTRRRTQMDKYARGPETWWYLQHPIAALLASQLKDLTY